MVPLKRSYTVWLLRALIALLILIPFLFGNKADLATKPECPWIEAKQYNAEDRIEAKEETDDVIRPFLVTVSPLFPDCDSATETAISKNEHLQRKEEGTEFLPTFLGLKLKITDFLLAVFTGGLFWATWLLWRSTRDLVRDARKVAENQSKDTRILERAYISVEAHGITAFDPNKGSYGHVGFRNVGRLPAREVRWAIKMEPSNTIGFLPITPDLPENQIRGADIPPGSEMRQDVSRHFTAASIEAFRNGGLYIYVWGVVVYNDGFGNKAWTNFCHRYDRRGYAEDTDSLLPLYARGPAVLNEGMRYHELGNDVG